MIWHLILFVCDLVVITYSERLQLHFRVILAELKPLLFLARTHAHARTLHSR